MTRNDLVERMILNHNPNSAPRMVIEQCADVAMGAIDVLNRDIGRLRFDLEDARAGAKMLREQVAWSTATLLQATQAHDKDRAELELVRSERVQLRAKLDAVAAALDHAEVPQTVPVEGTVYGSGEAAARVRWLDKARLADDTATAHEEDSAELAAVIALLDELDAPRVQDTHTLTPAERLGAYLDQRAEQVRTAAEDDAAEWADGVTVERGLVLAIAELGHALARGAR